MLHQQQQHQHHRGHAEDADEAGAVVVDGDVVGKTGSSRSSRSSTTHCVQSQQRSCRRVETTTTTEDSSFVAHLRGILDDPNQIQRYSNILRWMSNGTSFMLDISSSSRMKHQLFPKKKGQQYRADEDEEEGTTTEDLLRLLSVTDVYALLKTLKHNGFHTVHRNTCRPGSKTTDLYFIFQRYGFVAAAFAATAAVPSLHEQTIAHEDNARAALDEHERRQPWELEVDEDGKKHPTATAVASMTPATAPQPRRNKRKRSSSTSASTTTSGPKFKARIEEPFESFVERHYDSPADLTTSSSPLPSHDAQQSATYSYNTTQYYDQQQQQQQQQPQHYSHPQQYSQPQNLQHDEYYQQQYSQQQQYQQQYLQHAYYPQQYRPSYNSYSTTNTANLLSPSYPPWFDDSSQYYYQNAYQQQQQGWPLHPSPPSHYHPNYYSVPLHQQQQQFQHPQYPATTMVPTSSWGYSPLTQQDMEDSCVPAQYRRRRPSSAPTIVQLQQEPEHEQRRPQDPKQQQYHDPQRPQPPPLPSPLTASKSSSSSSSLRSSSLISFCSSQELHSLSFAPEEEGEHDIAIQHRRTATVARAPAVPTVSRSSFSSRRRISPIIMDTTAAFVAVPVPVDPQVCDNASSTTAAARTTTTSPVFSPVSAAAVATITNSGNGALSTIVTESCTGDDGIGTQKIYAPHQVYDEGEGVLDDNDDDASSYYTSLNDTSSNCDNGMSSSVVMTNKTSSRYYEQ